MGFLSCKEWAGTTISQKPHKGYWINLCSRDLINSYKRGLNRNLIIGLGLSVLASNQFMKRCNGIMCTRCVKLFKFNPVIKRF